MIHDTARPPLPFTVDRPVVGMIHLLPLPGAPRFGGSMEAVCERALTDLRALSDAGVDGVMVENFGDTPFHPGPVPPETVAAMSRVVALLAPDAPGPLGVNVLRNDADAALGIAAATGAHFIRVNVHVGTMWTDQGPLAGTAHLTLRRREALGISCPVLADVHVKHATPPAGERIEDAAADAWYRGGASGLVVSGAGTGRATDPGRVGQVADAVPEAPVWVGSGVTSETLPSLWNRAAGFIVGSSLQVDGRAGNSVVPGRAERFMETVHRLRQRG